MSQPDSTNATFDEAGAIRTLLSLGYDIGFQDESGPHRAWLAGDDTNCFGWIWGGRTTYAGGKHNRTDQPIGKKRRYALALNSPLPDLDLSAAFDIDETALSLFGETA